jgi:hypothetical protein
MSVQKSMLPAVVITGSSLLVGCGSNGSCGSGGSCNVPPPGTGGVFAGTVGGTSAVAILANNGDMRIGVQNGTYYHLTVAPQTATIGGSYFAYSTGAAFPNGTDATTGTVSGTEGASTLDGTLTDHSGTTEALTLNDNPVYTTGSALANLTGTWSYTAGGFSLTATIASRRPIRAAAPIPALSVRSTRCTTSTAKITCSHARVWKPHSTGWRRISPPPATPVQASSC